MLIKNGTIHDGLGFAGQRDLRIESGLITGLGESLPIREGEEVFDAAGMEVLPGFIQTISNWGVNGSAYEIRPSSNDNDERSDPITPDLDAFYAFNGRAITYQQMGAYGVTAVGVAPTDNNLFGGTIAAFTVDGVNPYKMCLKRDIAMMASVTNSLKRTYGTRQTAPQTRMWIFANFAEQLRKAAAYKLEEDKPEDRKLLALQRVVKGELPLFVACDSLTAAERVREITEQYPELRLVLINGFGLTGEENWIVEKRLPVVVRVAANPLDDCAMQLDLGGIAKLAEQGVPVVLSGTAANSFLAREDVLWNCAEMMKVIHDSERVLSMATSTPAKLLGIDGQTGSIREGLRADIVIWSANPMKTWQARIIRTYSGGEVIYRDGDVRKCI